MGKYKDVVDWQKGANMFDHAHDHMISEAAGFVYVQQWTVQHVYKQWCNTRSNKTQRHNCGRKKDPTGKRSGMSSTAYASNSLSSKCRSIIICQRMNNIKITACNANMESGTTKEDITHTGPEICTSSVGKKLQLWKVSDWWSIICGSKNHIFAFIQMAHNVECAEGQIKYFVRNVCKVRFKPDGSM